MMGRCFKLGSRRVVRAEPIVSASSPSPSPVPSTRRRSCQGDWCGLTLIGSKVIIPSIVVMAITAFIVTLIHPNVFLPTYAITRSIGAVLSIYVIDCMVTGGCSMGASILAFLTGISILMDTLNISIIGLQ